ncbi:MAG: DNA topoisomerase IV subunit A [Pirellulales bacterium]|nr:DNA topoisomerase IV subunit A [Pirellulales bacterium]
MAKKKASRRKLSPVTQRAPMKAKLTPRDKRTLSQLTGLADGVVVAARQRRDPHVDIPARALSNVRYSPRKRIIEMGKRTTRRKLFDLAQAKAFMQTMLVARGVKDLIDQGKSNSIRGLFYTLRGKIADTNEHTFDQQSDCDPIIEDVEVTLASLREEMHLFADPKGAMVGNIVVTDSGDDIDCSRMGSGGYAIPSIVEPDIMQFKQCNARFVLHVEKGTVWQRFNEDKFWRKHNCILTHGGGQPPRGVRRLLHRLHHELKLPVYCLLDNDPWGYYIYSVIKQGSINLAFESTRMAIPDARFLGIRSIDFERCGLSDSVKIDLNDTDRKRARQIASYPWFAHKKPWQREIKKLLDNGFKLEVEALISKDISYVTEEYTPARLKNKDWLD